jgi:hypothetical protein
MVGTFATLWGYNFMHKPSIKMKSEAKLELSLKAFQRCIAHHLHTRKSGQFSTFCGRKSNWQFWLPTFLFAITCVPKCWNGSYEPILDIYTSIAFQSYKTLFNVRCFNLYNCSLKVQESTRTPTPKMGVQLGVWIFMFTLSHTPFDLCPCKPLPWLWAQGYGCDTHRQLDLC